MVRFLMLAGRVLTVCALLLGRQSNAGPAGSRTFYDLSPQSIAGQRVKLSDYRRKVVLIVNTASGCGYTPQYEGLQALYSKMSSRGLVVLGFPSNDFGGQEPGTNPEIKKFCQLHYRVSFPLFAKGPVSGEELQPVFRWLTQEANPKLKGEIEWNFEKFLIDRNGKLIARFKSAVTPESPELVRAIDSAVEQTLN